MAKASNGNIELEYEEFGFADDPTLLLISGLSTQLLFYEEELCLGFRDRGFHVVRFDNRDIGLSTILDDDASYTLSDMAADAIAVLDAVGVDRAIMVGTSLGGMIAQTVAIEYPDRTMALVSVSSTTGEPDVGMPTAEAYEAITRPAAATVAEQIESDIQVRSIWASPEWFDPEAARTYFEAVYARSHTPGSAERQMHAILGAPSRVGELAALQTPTLVVHGDADTLIDVSGGRRTAELIPNAELFEVEGMGHDLPVQVWPALISAVTDLAQRAARTS